MAEPDIATKAPESDAMEDTPLAADTSAQQPPKMGEHCVTDRPTPSGEGPTGEIRKLGGVDVYVSKPSEYPHAPARLLLLLTGGTGLKSTNNQIQADRYASEGYVVVMPDLFDGDAAPNSTNIEESDAAATTISDGSGGGGALFSFLDTFKVKAAEAAKSFMIDMWLARHTEEKVMPILYRVLDAAKDEFADAVSNGGGVYAAGYCFGARYVLLLAGERATQWAGQKTKPDEESGKAETGPLIKAGVLAHATLVSREDFQGLKAPISLICVENDPLFPDEVRAAGEDYLSKNNVEHEVKVYPGVPHGFAVVGDYDDATIKEAQTTAYEQMLNWLRDH
ncbi:Alpha/beta-hydrolase [Pleurostoma richardsiae]|uniref:Alpha/beta-hydrolase n=1 Tax=Pleurostoma richardsiae TaxID=41990 RepID=A0AA38RS55_9PEZI|nr:Alpha/beta-hydrolase [Pleurostoma richardsiae]